MKKTLGIAFAAACVVLAASCTKDRINEEVTGNTITLTAFSETAKTSLNEGTKVFWSKTDKIGIIAQKTDGTWLSQSASGKQFSIADESYVPSTSASFTGTIADDAEAKYAVYPYYASGKRELKDYGSGQEDGIDINLPWTLTGVPGGFPENSNIMIGSVDVSGNIRFKNVCAIVKFTVTSDNVSSISFSTNSTKAVNSIAGHAYIRTADATIGRLASTSSDVSATITMTIPGSGVYYLPFLPNRMADGFKLSVDMKDGSRKTRTRTTAVKFERNTIYDFGDDTNEAFVDEIPSEIKVNVVFSDGTNNAWPFSGTLPTQDEIVAAAGKPMGPFSYGTYNFYLRIQNYVQKESCRITAGAGFRFGGTAGDYLLLPGISGYTLSTVAISCGTQATTVAVATNPASGESAVVTGGESKTIAANANGTYNLTDTNAGDAYRLCTTNTAFTGIKSLALTYKKVQE